MGYEQKFYFVDITTSKGVTNGKDKNWAEVIAMFDYCKDYELNDFVRSVGKDSNCFIFADDGNTEVCVDDYGDPLVMVDVDIMLGYLTYHKDSEYRRYKLFYDMVKSFSENKSKFRNLAILRYGH